MSVASVEEALDLHYLAQTYDCDIARYIATEYMMNNMPKMYETAYLGEDKALRNKCLEFMEDFMKRKED